jgi:hypothetical protein
MQNGFVALVMLIASPVAASTAQRQEGANLERVPPLRLASPDWQPMNGQQLAAALTGRDLIVDEDLPTLF